MKKIFSALVLAVTLVLLFLSSCATEEPAIEKQTGSLNVNRAADYFNNNPIALKNNLYFLGKPDWKKAVYVRDTLTVPFITERPIFVKNGARKNNSGYFLRSYLLVTPKKGDNSFDYKLKVTFSPKANEAVVKWYHIYNQANTLISENGKRPIKKRLIKSEMTFADCVKPSWEHFLSCSEAERERILNELWECANRNNRNVDHEVPPPDGGSEEEDPVDIIYTIEDYIDDTQLDPCTKQVLKKLKNLTVGDIAAMIKRFSGDEDIFMIKMSTGQLPENDPNDWAQTKFDENTYTVNMVFNEDYINGKDNPNPPTDLSVATTMAHEIVHAYLISMLNENNTLGTSEICDFPTVYEAYVQYQITKDKTILPAVHHELIADKYVNAIAATIQEFHTGVSVDSGFPNQVYLDMAWAGLYKTNIFIKNYPNDPNHKNFKDRQRIYDRINTEKLGAQYGVNFPLGTPCKK
ncbi:hypothetical protein [Flavobacterium poyangense]|uniref:hypothetical protein n=1 Tax=Flavobacterium poyangense TaxID=2204302 RepID=UPI00142163AD|nr:hypothetical protein [Flavobacterium sp. JXAS1]